MFISFVIVTIETGFATGYTTGFYQLSFGLTQNKVAKKKPRLLKNCLNASSFS